MITHIKGDATKPIGDGLKIITHICNNKGGWGAGFVLAISRRWLEPETHYRSLQEYQLGKTYVIKVEPDIIVANMIAQNGFVRPNYVPLDYVALNRCLNKLNTWAKVKNATIHMPMIGAGLGGGDWERILKIIENSALVDNVIYEYGG